MLRLSFSLASSAGRLAPALLAIGATLLVAPGCRAVPAQVALHWPTQLPPPLESNDPVLWIALASRLGPGVGGAAQAPPLVLEAATGSLSLVDAAGRRQSGTRLSLRWREVPLAEPLPLRRSVLGPFASFESAEQAANTWRAAGIAAQIAYPLDWEVWAPVDATPPKGFQVRTVERLMTSRLGLEAPVAGSTPILLEGPIQITAPGGLRWQGGVFKGPFRLQPNAYGGWSLIEQVPIERYLLGVVPHEIGAASPAAALAAQAVLARTWALRNRHRFATDGYHLCADTQCQVYADPRQAGAAVSRAIQATRGRVLSWKGEPIHAVYHATNGGISAGFEEVWSGVALPYLQARPDGPAGFARRFTVPLAAPLLPTLLSQGGQAYGADHPRFRWQRLLSAERIRADLDRAGAGVGLPLRLKVLERGPSGRVVALAIQGSTGERVLRLDAIRRTFRQLPSTLFELVPDRPGSWRFQGGGFGHGAGLSQAGAIDLAARGWSLERILEHYYPGTDLQTIPSLEGRL
ncbi:SpoIID/LytB domain-containing protein [Synechococcus sp. CS-1324]|uniref:SpoIID/LytB domain-containing protein n=1 Tax=Synechococcus sp. CS-1324 TaxID=2847980 RepID=UPI000DB1A0D7|nr:SpoIID/LytB domain-containing protein [Synechococcus sp. CS-1324]MCT0231116.1 SpoIID/LytB domain-containing protein [Synechococcus sp. CS-1324]PZV04407.1 MAG: amidase [Cyanobium sp.]